MKTPSTTTARDVWVLVSLACLAVLLRWISLLAYESTHPLAGVPVIDERSYDEWARRIAAGDWLGGTEVWFQEPLYPYVLALIYKFLGDALHTARVVQCVWWGLSGLLVAWTARRLFGQVPAVITAAAWALYGAGMVFPALLLKENLFLPILAGLACLLVLSRTLDGLRALAAWLLVGVLVGAGALLRGNMLVLVPMFVLWPLARTWWERESHARTKSYVRALQHSACVVVGLALALMPVLWRNHHVGGVWVLTTSGAGTNLYGGNNPENPWGRATEFSFVRGIPAYEAGDWNREAERRLGRELDPKETSDYWLQQVLQSVQRDPGLHASILWNKLRLTLGAYEVPDNHMIEWDAQHVPLARWLPSWGVWGMLGLAGVLWFALGARVAGERSGVQCVGGARELALLFAAYLVTIVLTVTSDRARLPLLVPLLPFAGWMCVQLYGVLRAHTARGLSISAFVLVCAGVAVHAPALPSGERQQDFDEREYNLAVVWRDQPGREEDARQMAMALQERHPRSVRVRLLVAELEFRAAARQRDAARLRELAERGAMWCDAAELVARERFRGCALQAWCLLELGDGAAAAQAFASARAFDGDDVQLRRGAARSWLLLAESDAAQRAEHAQAARQVLSVLAPEPETRVLRAQCDFEQARSLVRGSTEARVAIQRALDELEVASQARTGNMDTPLMVRAEARRLAGWIQLWLGNPRGASGHFRAALDLGDAGTAELGLLSALVARAEAGETEAALLAEVDGRLATLPAGPAVDELRARRARLSPAPR